MLITIIMYTNTMQSTTESFESKLANKKYVPVLSHEQINMILICLEKLKERRYDIENALCYAKEKESE